MSERHLQSPVAEDDDLRVQTAALVLRLRALGLADRAVLKAMETVPRALFVPAEWREQAYEDRSLPIECGQTIGTPSLVAQMTAALELSDRHSVLEIGTGSGYQAAVLARLARRVTTIDRYRTLVRSADQRWKALGIRNISGVVADGALGWKLQAPFDRILVTASFEAAPSRLVSQLTDSGILIAPIGQPGRVQRLTLFQRIGQNVDTRDIGPVRLVPIVAGVAQSL
jgi:protein-L-isoaspartate(D-aspartate) O-methyltransferase